MRSWPCFNANTTALFGTGPSNASGTIDTELIAENAFGLSTSETFSVSIAVGHATVHPYGGRLLATPQRGRTGGEVVFATRSVFHRQ